MKKMKILTQAIAAIATIMAMNMVAVEIASGQSQPEVRKLMFSRKINSITPTVVSNIDFEVGWNESIGDVYVTDKDTIFVVLEHPDTGYTIKVVPQKRSLQREFRCSGPVWNPPLTVKQITTDDSGNIYAAVERPIKRGGIIVVNARGTLVSKLTLTDFVPFTIAVDHERRIWVAGWEVDRANPSELDRPIAANAEQLRVYDQNLHLLGIPVRNLRREMYVCSLGAVDNEVIYYAVGTDELYMVKNGKLTDRLLVGDIPKLELPLAARGQKVTVRRGVKWVSKLDNHIIVGGFYNYHWEDSGRPKSSGKNFVVLIDLQDSTFSGEFEAPGGSLVRSGTSGQLVYLSAVSEGGYRLKRTSITF